MSDSASPSSGAERRASVRQHFEWDMACELTSYGESDRWPAAVRDISVDGIGLIIERSFPSGTVLEIELSSRDESLSYIVVARVNHSRPTPDGRWQAGCSFVGRLSDEELTDLL
jgi:hypothetical protein